MQAGKLRHRVTIVRLSTTPARDANNQEIPAEGSRVDRWASVETIEKSTSNTGNEQWSANSVLATATHKVTLRGGTTINELDQILWGSRTFEVVSVLDPDGRAVMTVVYAMEQK